MHTNGLFAARNGVVVGFDASEDARRAVEWATDEALSRTCSLLIAHAHQPQVPILADGWGPVFSYTDEPVHAAMAKQIEELADRYRATALDIEVTATVVDGHPAEVLARTADRFGAALLVLGPPNAGPLARVLLGSTVTKLVDKISRPVVVVRGVSGPASRDRPVVVGVDETSAGSRALGFGFAFAARHLVPLHVVHASDRPAEQGREPALGVWPWTFPQVPVSTEIVTGQPARTLLERSDHGQLLVVGTHGHSALHRALRGSVSRAAIYHAHCPVALVPDWCGTD